jgi:tRNA/rRNA methyltransferase
MQIKIVLVGPEYQQNIGYCCRVMKNFGFTDLYLVKPDCKIGQEAVMYAKHAADVLKNAKIAQNLDQAIKGCSLIVGTTAIQNISRDLTRDSITPEELAKKFKGNRAKIALLMGREGTGLTKEELQKCDVVVRIEGNLDYPTLNLSHALAIILYELTKDKSKSSVKFMDEREKKLLIKHFNSFVDRNKQGLRSPATIKLAFKRVLGRGIRSQLEARALLQMLKKLK